MRRIAPGLVAGVCLLGAACAPPAQSPDPLAWSEAVRDSSLKVDPVDDPIPPVLHADGWSTPVPVGFSSSGAEDSPFVTADGRVLIFFYTPDLSVPAQQQLGDGVTGLWITEREGDGWTDPVRIVTTRGREVALDGCGFFAEPTLWFCSVRTGNDREIDIYTSDRVDDGWSPPEDVGEPLEVAYGLGELHIAADGATMYYHSTRPGGHGDLDIWVTRLVAGDWTEPENVSSVNTAGVDGWPFLSSDGSELWITRIYEGSPALYRSRLTDGEWGAPELIVSGFAAEASLDDDGNLYFTHHLHRDGEIVEADIYVAHRR